MEKITITKKELAQYRKANYKRGFIIGAILALVLAGVGFVIFCHALIAIA